MTKQVKVDGDVYLCKGSWGRDKGVQEKVFSADGEVKLVGAEIGGTLECRGGVFNNSDSKEPALNAKGLKVGGSVLLHNGFIAKGEVSLLGATITGKSEFQMKEASTSFFLTSSARRMWSVQLVSSQEYARLLRRRENCRLAFSSRGNGKP